MDARIHRANDDNGYSFGFGLHRVGRSNIFDCTSKGVALRATEANLHDPGHSGLWPSGYCWSL
jgi:hypothetical protein